MADNYKQKASRVKSLQCVPPGFKTEVMQVSKSALQFGGLKEHFEQTHQNLKT